MDQNNKTLLIIMGLWCAVSCLGVISLLPLLKRLKEFDQRIIDTLEKEAVEEQEHQHRERIVFYGN